MVYVIYVLYVEFQKAFDCLVHYKLVSNMLSKGANGNLIRLLMSMYEKLENYVKIPYSPLHLNRRENSMSRDKSQVHSGVTLERGRGT
mgnify:CR=1 FL=1